MIRVVIMMIAMALGLTILRSVIGFVVRLISSFIRPQSQQPPMPSQPGQYHEPAAQLLRRCGQCGTYTPDSAARKSSGGGDTLYFCSADCQAKAAVKV